MEDNRPIVKTIVKSIKWKFSAINGGPFLGKGLKTYATRQFNIKLPEDQVLQKLIDASNYIENVGGIKVLRKKIEKVIFDTRLDSTFKCKGGCIE